MESVIKLTHISKFNAYDFILVTDTRTSVRLLRDYSLAADLVL